MDEQRDGVRRLFDTLSGAYDQSGVPFFGPIAELLVQAVGPRPGERVLDIGCGRGAAIEALAAAVGTEGAVTGVDFSPAMLAGARQLVQAKGLHQVDLMERDAQDLDIEPKSFDAAIASLVVFFLPDPATAVRRWAAALRAGGRLGVSTFAGQDPRWAQVDEVLKPWLPSLDARSSGSEGFFRSDEGVERLLREAGLTEVRTVRSEVPVVFRDADQWQAFSQSTGQRAAWDAVPAASRSEVEQEARRRLAEVSDSTGAVTFVQPVRYTLGVAA